MRYIVVLVEIVDKSFAGFDRLVQGFVVDEILGNEVEGVQATGKGNDLAEVGKLDKIFLKPDHG